MQTPYLAHLEQEKTTSPPSPLPLALGTKRQAFKTVKSIAEVRASITTKADRFPRLVELSTDALLLKRVKIAEQIEHLEGERKEIAADLKYPSRKLVAKILSAGSRTFRYTLTRDLWKQFSKET